MLARILNIKSSRTRTNKMEEKERLSTNLHCLCPRFRVEFSRSLCVTEYVCIIIVVLLGIFLLGASVKAESLQAPRFITQPSSSSSIVSEGRTKILQCQALGYPPPQYRWLKDSVELGEFSTEHFYRILNTRREDGGSYQCVAKNDVGSILSKAIDVSVAYMGVFEDQSERTVSVALGEAAILDFPAILSHPEPLVIWQADDGTQLYGRKYAVTAQHQLIILSVTDSDQKAYRARATNTQLGKEENSAYIRLVIRGGDPGGEIAPEIIVSPKDMNILKDSLASELQCIVNARPLHELETLWMKDGIPIENTGISYNLNDPWNHTLSLVSANLTHTGRYTCQARLRSGGFPTVTADAQVTVFEAPTFVSNIRPETLGEYGTTVTLPCEVTGTPVPSVRWLHNTQDVMTSTQSDRYMVEEDKSLVIKKLRMDDTGMYQCVATNEAGSDSVNIWLKVKTSAPIMEVPPQNVTVLDGKDAIISCRVAGAPTPNITWIYQDSEPVDLSGRLQVLESGDLLVAAVRESDAGKYSCVRANEAGQVTAAGYLSVLVRTQIIQPPVDTRVLLGNTATLQCKVSSDPTVPYQVDWFHNGQPVGVGTQRVSIAGDGTLEIQAVRAADVGDYTCALVSPGGNETRTARLSVIELPFAPTNLVATRLDHRLINLTWAPGFDGNSEIIKYIVQRREVSDLGPIPDPLLNWVTELSNVSASKRWVLLRNLKAAASYQFRVSAVNSVGEGSPSDPSNVVALPQEPPSGPPLGFAGSARSSSEIITQWQPPLEEHRNGQVLGYIIRYRLYGYNESPWTSQNITNEAQRNFLIQELITWKDYVLQIAAYNNKGVGVFSDGIKIKTKEGVPEAPPTNVKAEAINSTAIQVWWKPPHPQKINGINQGYKLQAFIGDSVSNVLNVPPSLFDPLAQQSAVISGLRKYTTYNLTVLCFTDPGDGLPSHPVEVTTQEDVPDEVSRLQFEDISDRAVKVVWSPPENANGVLTGYTLSYSVKDKPDTLKTENFTADTLSVKVAQLQATTHYRFEVNAWTSKGPGPKKVATIQSGVEPVLPSPPTKLAVTNIEAFSVVLQFTPGFDGNSSITKWTVEAQTARNTSWFPAFEESSPDAMTLTVVGLIPFTLYRLRLIARNVVGPSEPSEPTKEFQTIQAPPSHPPRNVTVRAMSDTELRVRWIPLQQSEWFGNPRGYNITYREVGSPAPPRFVTIEDHTANSHVLDKLEEFAQYEIVLTACNDVGVSVPSPVALERTRESVPSFGPMNVGANATSSTTIVVHWGDVPREHRNGQIEGFKVFYGTGPRSPLPVQVKDIPSNATFTTTLTELRKFVVYSVQVLAYTRLGDGALSTPPVRVQTFEDAPGAPSNVSFPDVSLTTARIIWDVPEEPNGQILAYRVNYHLQATGSLNFSREFVPSDRTYRAAELEPEQYYLFSVTAQTRLGWGKVAHALVYTTNNRETPQPPSAPQLSRSQVQAQQITFSWTPGRDGFAPLRYYTVQLAEGVGPWVSIQERVDPGVTSYTATALKPYTSYRFRIQATNDIGPSGWSVESSQVRTLPAAPSKEVSDVKVVPITTTSVRVEWQAIPEDYWSGDTETGGYRILFQPVSDFPTSLQATPKQEVKGIKTTQVVLTDLTRDRNYEIVVVPYNSQGSGPAAPPVAVYVGEAVPTGQPRGVVAEPVSSTEVRLRWQPPQQRDQNGDLLGYKIFYLATELAQDLSPEDKVEEELEVVPASYTSYSLVFLDKFTQYRIQILAFNPAGDGPRSTPVSVKTLQGLPGPPSDLRFSEITMTSLLVSWDPPKKRNGELIGYIVTYETAEQNERFSKQVKQKVSDTSLVVQTLEEEVTYTFTVRAQTIDYGPAVRGNVTTGPQEGSPTRPKELTLGKTVSSVELHWVNGASGKGPILGYYFQSRRKAVMEDWQRYDTRWSTVTRTGNGPLQEFAISYQNLLPSTAYNFRVISYNKYGISYPAYSEDVVLTPSKLYLEYGYLQMKPFYRQTWFMVALAATSIVIIIMVVAVLCVKSKSYKYKQEAQKTLEESMAMDIDDRQQLAMELYRSRHSGGGGRGTLARKHLAPPGPPMLGKSPPRPSPASVAYHSDEESLKGYDENPDDSSVTEKPSEISSSDSQGSESENESVRSDPHSFVNHYANVNDSLRQSWKRQKPVRNYSSYTDSEPEGSAVVSLNGGQIIMNNMARSRAPLPGFSSFV
ncbi:protein sidekick isoform X3 [Homalodisca vitripennis]|uniref:protein sidekick isoform X3 n=1 Tax=Homalodisca vitripennis TaxID=197043 RepID=UPI001EEC616C|nr:protein sidekick isoform X3 [Homalodisca vitripennis]